MQLGRAIVDLVQNRSLLRDADASGNLRLLFSLLGPAQRIRPRQERAGLLAFEHGKAAPDLTSDDLLAEG
jgi:hypothetical protein